MNRLLTAVYLALMIAPLLALAAATPYVMIQYRRTKMVHVPRCANLYLLIVFFLCAFFMTLLPFPTMGSVLHMTGGTTQLVPFYWVYDFFTNSALRVSDWTTIFPALSGNIFLGVVFNIIMLMPTGFFTRSLFRISAAKAVLIGLCISLFFELTQLTGVWGLYPRAYRIFDVDDLMQNALGFWLGFMIQPCSDRLLPSAKRKQIVRKGGEVSMHRRFLADMIDQALCVGLAMIVFWCFPSLLRSIPAMFLVLLIMQIPLAATTVLTRGVTPGMRLAGLQMRSVTRRPLSFMACFLRSAMYIYVNSLPVWIFYFMSISEQYSGKLSVLLALSSALCVFAYVCFLLSLMLNIVTHGEALFYDSLTGMHLGLRPGNLGLSGMRELYVGKLSPEGVTPGLDAMDKALSLLRVGRKDMLRVRLMAEAALLEWMEKGLRGTVYDVRLDVRFFHKTVMLSIAGWEVPLVRSKDSYVEILSGTRLSFDSYYTGGVNVFAIDVP